MTEVADAAAAWAQYSVAREKRTFATTSLLAAVIVPAWSALDFYLEPSVAPRFLVARLIDVTIVIGLWIFISRSNDLVRNRIAMTGTLIATGFTGVWLLPQVRDHYLLYTLGFSLVFWGAGVILILPLRHVVIGFATILVADVIAELTLDHASSSTFIGLYFYVASAAVISAAQIVVRRTLEHEAFLATFALQQRNEMLATTQARLHASSAVLAESLDANATARLVVELAVPAVATWATLVGAGPGGTRVCGAAHTEVTRTPAIATALIDDQPRDWPEPNATAKTSRDDLIHGVGARVAELVTARSLIVTPLIARGERTGTLVLGWADRAYEPNERVFAEEIAHRAALALDNARLFREAEAAIGLRDDFISIASHELRTPLSALVLTVESQLAATPVDDPHHKIFEKLDRNVVRLSTLVTQLLDVSQLAAAQLVLERADMDLVALVREIVEHHAELARRAGSTFELELPATLSGSWDRARLERAIANLVGNAIKYGRGRPISIRLEPANELVRLSIRDDGIGIAPGDQQRIFGRFERATGSTSTGFGLGLWIARTIIEAHGGTIRCTSELDRGSTFVVELVQPSA